jgi:hypothetical protein
MIEITRDMIMDTLREKWGPYVERFQRLSPDEQRVFLVRQGYPHLRGLLGHVIAWWELGKYSIEQILIDPAYKGTDIDVDLFNARAIERFSGESDDAVIAAFEKMRSTMLDFVKGLPQEAFLNKRINERLYIEFIDHFEEHLI